MFKDKIAEQIDTLKKLDKFPKKGLDIAIDMHLIPCYDRVPGEELTRSKYKNGTTYFERYMTVQCVNDSMRVILVASYLKMLESVPDYVDIVLKTMAEMDIKIHQVLLDREFFSVDAISRLQENNVKFLMPCKNTGNVVAALREFAQKKREKISRNVIENNRGSATYYSNAHKFLYSQFLDILVPWPSHLCVNHRLLHSERYLYTFNVFFSRKFVN